MIVDPKYETIDAPWFVDFHNLDDLLPNQRGILTKITRNWWMHVLRSASSRLALSSTSESRPYYWPRYWAWWLRSYTKCVCVCVCSYCVTFFKKNYAYAGEHGNGTDDVFEAASSGYHKRRQPVMSRAPATTTKKAGNRDEARQKLKFLRSVAKNCNEQDSARPSKRPKVGGLPDRRRPRPTATSLLRA